MAPAGATTPREPGRPGRVDMCDGSPSQYDRRRLARPDAHEECVLCEDAPRSAALPWPICARCAFAIHDMLSPLCGGRPRPPVEQPFQSPRARDRQGHVYYARRGGLIKIGFTSSLANRMRALLPDEVLATEPGTLETEHARHQQFAEWRDRGNKRSEWFADNPELRAHIARLVAQYGDPPALPTLTAPRQGRRAS